jgi:CRP-like cAMP-binding protein
MRRRAVVSELPARPPAPVSTGSYYPSPAVDVLPVALTVPPPAGERLRNSFGVHARCTERARRLPVGATLAVDLLDARAMPGPASLRSLAARNTLLASLSGDALRRWQSAIEHVRVTRGQILAAPGVRLPYAYFPLRGVVALVAMTTDGGSVQVGTVGSDGVLGLPTVLHDDVLPYQAVAPVTLDAVRLRLPVLIAEARSNTAFQARLLAYAHQQVTAMTRAAACHRFHTTLQRLCLWLLTVSDSLHSDTLEVTQDLLAQFLGTTRTGISLAATTLSDDGVIRQRWGRVQIVRRMGLSARACDCYEAPTKPPVHRTR